MSKTEAKDEYYSSMMELSLYHSLKHIGIFTFCLDGHYSLVYGNDCFYGIIGYTEQEIKEYMNGRCCGFIYPEDIPLIDRVFQEAMNLGEPHISWEMRIVTGDKQLKHLEISGDLVRRENDAPLFYGVATDITERKARETSVRNRYEVLLLERESIDQNAIGSFWLDLTANVCRDGHARDPYILELQNEGTVDGFFQSDYEHNLDNEILGNYKRVFNRENLLRLYHSGSTTVSFDHKFLLPHGKYEWVQTVIKMRSNPETGHIEGLIYGRNIHREKLERALCAKLIDTEYDFVTVIDAHTEIVEFSQGKSRKIRGIPRNGEKYTDYMESSLTEFVEPENRNSYRANLNFNHIKQVLDKQGSMVFTLTVVNTSTGITKYIRTRFIYMDSYHENIAYSCSDMTNYFKREHQNSEKLKKALAAEKANTAKTLFLSRMSHDIRTPISAIVGLTALAEESFDDGETVRDCFKKIKDSSNFLLGLINDMLDIATIENGKFVLHPVRYEYEDFVGAVRSVFETQCAEKELEFIFDNAMLDEMSVPLMVDRIRFNQLFFNLLSNAFKYTEPGGRVTFKIFNIHIHDEIFSADYEVSDTGIGIDEKFQQIMFEPFSKENRMSSTSQGVGLGMSIAKNIVDAMGGTINVRSKKGYGTTITVHLELPIAEAAATTSFRAAQIYERRLECIDRLHVLLVDDHPLNNEILATLLKKKGITVKSAFDGQQAVNEIRDNLPGTYDIVLMDIHMPVKDGLEATREIRALPREDALTLPIVALSANAFSHDINQALEAGMNAHLSKPVDMDMLISTLLKFTQ